MHTNPTLRPYPQFRADADCEGLYKAMKGLGTDEQAIIDILAHRTADQRVQIVQKYKTMYGKDLVAHLKSELSGRFEDVVKAMCCSLDDLDATTLRKAMKGLGTDEDILIEILCSRNNTQIRKIKEAYARLFDGRDLEADIESETSGDFKRVLVSLVQGKREMNLQVDRNAVREDAQALFEAGEKKLGTDEAVFNRILASKSEAHIRAVINEYSNVAGNDFEDALKSELSGDVLKSYMAITQCVRNKPKYFAGLLKKSMAGAGTADRLLIHIVVSRCEIDMGDIKEEFMKANGKSLEDWISSDTSGDYKKMLLALVA